MKKQFQSMSRRRTACLLGLLILGNAIAQAATWYVSPSGNDLSPGTNWGTAKQTLQAAITASANSDTVLVTNGTYASGTVNVSGVSTLVDVSKSITIQSVNSPLTTIIQGGAEVMGVFIEVTNVTLAGFTIKGASLSGVAYAGGIYCSDPSDVVTNCIITGNTGVTGGGVHGGTLNKCILSNNIAADPNQLGGGFGGGIYQSIVSNCVISSNFASLYGGGAYQATLNNSIISNNTCISGGGGAFNSTLSGCLLISNSVVNLDGGGASISTLNNCSLIGNKARIGGGANGIGNVLNNCLIASNTASLIGGGVFNCALNNCTVVYNNCPTGKGGGTSEGNITNSIVYFNTASVSNNLDSPAAITYSCTVPLPAGTGNLSNAPLFVATNNFHQLAVSPCVNSGNNAYAAGITDLDGNPRIAVGTVDIGAYELPLIIATNHPKLTGCSRSSNGAFQFTFTNNEGAFFSVLTSTNSHLPWTNWTRLGSPIYLGSGSYQFTDLTATNKGPRYYRLRSP